MNAKSLVLLMLGATLVMGEKMNRPGPFGTGEQFTFDFDRWEGKEVVITRLIKENEVFIFARTTKDRFEIRSRARERAAKNPNGEVLFGFDRTCGVDLFRGKLADVFREGDRVTALLYGPQGYTVHFATKKKPVLERGKFLLVPKAMKTPEWYWIGCIYNHAYYSFDELDGGIDAKIASAKLVGLEKIEFRLKDRDGNSKAPDVFSFSDNKVIRNGVDDGRILRAGVIDEEKILEDLSKESDNEIRNAILQLADHKEEFLKIIFENHRNKATYEAIKTRVDQAFENE